MSRIPPHLIEELRAGRVIAFVGAGFSAPAGFPGWKQLLLKIAQAAYDESAIPAGVHELVKTLLGAQWPSAAELDQAAQLMDDSLPSSAGQPQERLVGYMRKFLEPKQWQQIWPLPPHPPKSAPHTFTTHAATDLNELRSEIASLLGPDGPPTAYAIINDKSELQRKFFNKHEGVHLISFDTSAPAGWGGFDEILEELAAAVR